MDIEIGDGIYHRNTGPTEEILREGSSRNRKWVTKDGIVDANKKVNREVKIPETMDIDF